MKNLIYLPIAIIAIVLATSGITIAATPWNLNMSEPVAESSNKKLNISYNILSTASNNSFLVELTQTHDGNTQSLGTQTVNTSREGASGDNGLFKVDMPDTGVYSYTITATNDMGTPSDSSDDESKSKTESIEVVDGPEPTIIVVEEPVEVAAAPANNTAQPTNDNNQQEVVQTNEEPTENIVNEDEGQVAGAESDINEELATAEDEGRVLGEQAAGEESNSGQLWVIAGLVVALFAAVSFIVVKYRRKLVAQESE